MKCETDLSLIVTIVKKGWGDEILCASMEAGAEGGRSSSGGALEFESIRSS